MARAIPRHLFFAARIGKKTGRNGPESLTRGPRGGKKPHIFPGPPGIVGFFHCCVSCYTTPVPTKNGTLENPVTCRAVHRQDAEEPFHELPESPDEGRSVYVVVFDAVGL